MVIVCKISIEMHCFKHLSAFNYLCQLLKRYILLDGYNIIYASEALKHLMPNNKSRARESLA